ncbi:MAG: hypothetical protein KF805_13480 [Phycisphaeraceae bacterium]|nr:hypothetical protein [Phycisphaeraceae bacterium]
MRLDLRAKRKCAACLVLAVAGAALADGTLSLQLGAWSPVGNRANDASLQPSATCGGATWLASVNTNVPYAIVKLSSTGVGAISVKAEAIAPATGLDPFLGAYCAAPPATMLLSADDDSGGYPTALLSGARGLTGGVGKKFYVMIASYSARPERRYGSVKLTVTGPAVIQKCLGDTNYDGAVDDADFSLFVQGYNLLLCSDPAMITGCPADLNGDGFVDDADFTLFVGGYNTLLCP